MLIAIIRYDDIRIHDSFNFEAHVTHPCLSYCFIIDLNFSWKLSINSAGNLDSNVGLSDLDTTELPI